MNYIQHNISGRTNIDPAPITRKDSEISKSTSCDEDKVSKSEEDIVLNSNVFSADSSSSDDNDS